MRQTQVDRTPPTARGLRLATTALALAFMLVATPSPGGVLATGDVAARTGRSIDAWGAAWWQWAFLHPDVLGDTTGASGALGDVGGPVFFAEGSGGGAVTLNYAVPSRQFVLLPVATYIWTLFDPCADVVCAAAIVDRFVDGIAAPFASIDGVPVTGLASHVVRADGSSPFVFQVDAGPIGPDGYGGILDALQGGLWLMLEPLSPGTHVLRFGATVPLLDPGTGDPLDGTIALDTTLTLLAVPEPSDTTLLGLGALALALAIGRRPRRRRTTR